jgi:pilus assembly protein CpaE
MDEPLNVLCLGTDPAVSRQVIGMLSRLPGFSVTTREVTYDAGGVRLREGWDPHLAVVVLGADPGPGLAAIEEVHRTSPSAQVLALAPEENPETIIKALRAGADEFLPLPLDGSGLLKICIKVSAIRSSTSKQNGRPRGEVWVVHGVKGGVGVTTLVANLGIALRAAGRGTAVIDLDVHSGDLALFLNVTPGYSLRDIATNFKRLDSVFLQGTMVRHRSGLELLAAPAPVPGEPLLALAAEQTLAILDLLDRTHEVTVVDGGSFPLESTRAALGCADRILLVTELSLPSLRACMRTLDWLRQEGIDPAAAVEVVVNKHASKSWEVAPAEAAKTLNVPIRALVPRDDAVVCEAVNGGRPLEEVKAAAPVHRAIAALAVRPGSSRQRPASAVVEGFRRLFAAAERRVTG